MKAGDWTDAHSALMEAAVAETAAGEVDLDATWDRIAGRIAVGPRRSSRKRASAIIAVSVVFAGAGTAAAAAGVFSAHTGEYNSGWEVQAGGPGERLDPRGEDFAQVTLEETADIPFPSEQARSISAQTQIEEMQRGQVSTGALRGFVADDAICSWSNAWAAAVAEGDAAGARTASSTLLAAGDWSAVSALDTELVMRSTQVSSGDGTVHQADDSSRFGYLSLVQQSVKAGDVDGLGPALAENVRCIPALMADLPQAVPSPGQS
jgi:hypothetical protein